MKKTLFSIAIAMAAATGVQAQTTPIPPPAPAPPPNVFLHGRDQMRSGQFALDLLSMRSTQRMERAYVSANSFVGCANRLHAKGLAVLLGTTPGSREELHASRDLSGRLRVCAIGVSYVPLAILRGAAAEILAEDMGSIQPEMIAKTLDVARYKAFAKSAPTASGQGADDPAWQLQRAAQCHVVLAPGLSADVLAQKIGSAAEAAAFKTLYSSAPVCAGPIWSARLSVPFQRAMLAEVMYHWLRTGRKPARSADVSKFLPGKRWNNG